VFTITPRAVAVMRTIAEHRSMEPTSGLRIARRPDPSAPLEVRAVRGPRPGDSVVARDGARLYLGPGAEGRMVGGELDAVTDAQGRVQFVLRSAA
jgi:hypothetical protein